MKLSLYEKFSNKETELKQKEDSIKAKEQELRAREKAFTDLILKSEDEKQSEFLMRSFSKTLKSINGVSSEEGFGTNKADFDNFLG